MLQFYNTRDPVDLWLDVEDFERILLVCVTPLNTEFSYCLTGAIIWQSKAPSVSLRDFLLLQSWTSGNNVRCFPRFHPHGLDHVKTSD